MEGLSSQTPIIHFRKKETTTSNEHRRDYLDEALLYVETEAAEVAKNTEIEIAEQDTEAHCSAG